MTKSGVSQITAGSGAQSHKYKRKKLRLDESVEQIAANIENSIKQSKAQNARIGQIEAQSLKENYRGLQIKGN